MNSLFPSWSTSQWPTQTTLRSVDPTFTSDLIATLSSVQADVGTQTDLYALHAASEIVRGARASLEIISAQAVLATATDEAVRAEATEVIFHNTVNLHDLYTDANLYSEYLSRPANIIYLSVFAIYMLYLVAMLYKSRYTWFNVAFVCGYILEFLGFLGRVLSFTDFTDINFFLLQFVSLTLAPAFIMGGIYFLFAQMVMLHGRKYSVLSPMWYSYLFISFDVLSLVIQAIGGAFASEQTRQHKDSNSGTNIMIAGIAFQVASMSIFLGFWFEFLNRAFFSHSKEINSDSPYNKRSLKNFFSFLFNTKGALAFKQAELDSYYNPDYADIRARKLARWYPLAITLATICIYIRCVYRVVELAQGWSGYLITHEVYLMTLDALMIAFAAIVFVPFHPVWVFGEENRLNAKTIRNHGKKKQEETFQDDKSSTDEQENDRPESTVAGDESEKQNPFNSGVHTPEGV